MANTRGRNTKPEMAVRRELHRLGCRYRSNFGPVAGVRRTADIAFTRRKVAVFFFNDSATTEIYPLPLHDALPINDTATTEIYTLSLHDALPISVVAVS